ncbi:SMP-30/gluconolactonase/LRE family protein [Actinomycetospora termitidis]|uniref:SMP-30/gluconolactonase/LRE family protein n=1 Tax=Actinomycetospora termitidis TaxID=3053470 RepID=A0ABT7M6C5_9PSEU|nr:SMP-30/gluconolactonase/LRE family protein [Actinomycetospora sp. Odt1-22]MDL5156211.1 SMP-30/gluconolactonase/LRE family protein [Actinomycetospora sp. Odt1-22]
MGTRNPLLDWEFDPDAVRLVGKDLQRPECILAERDGTLWTADARGGVVRIHPDGTQDLVVARPAEGFDTEHDLAGSLLEGTLPNGLAFTDDGDILIANFGTDALETMDRAGNVRTLHDTIDGQPLGKVNFVLRDRRGRTWITVSTMVNPWSDAIGRHVADGYVALLDDRGLRVVADGFAFTNEIRFDADEQWLYVAETTAKRVSRLRIADDGSVLEREVFGPSSLGDGLVDGITFDAVGNIWATMIFADRLVALTPEGELLELFNDGYAAATARFEEEFAAGGPVAFETLSRTGGTLAPWLASVTFGGPRLDQVLLGSLRGTTLPSFPSPVPGLPPVHW